jgi:nucleoid DNA-binding protein
MAGSKDILQRTAARLGLDPAELQPYMDAMLVICADALDRGDCVELMTFGTICPSSDEEAFRPHNSLFPPPSAEGA